MSPFANSSKLSQILQDVCLHEGQLHLRAIARNLLAEHRVSEDRFLDFCKACGELISIAEIRRALEDYQINHVRPFIKDGHAPAYARSENANNLANSLSDPHVGTVLDLTRLGRVYAEAKSTFRLAEFRTYEVTDPRNRTQINEFLAIRLGDQERRQPFLSAVFNAMARYRTRIEDRVHPTWAAQWRTLQPFLIPDSPRMWLQAVGVPRDEPVWLAVLRYPIKNRHRELKLFRPTQLDAGWYAHHFPSPPQAEVSKGGHTMFLAQDDGWNVSPPPVSEFVHEQVDFGIRDWIAGGKLVGFTGNAVKGTLDYQREQHFAFLQTIYGKELSSWMPSVL